MLATPNSWGREPTKRSNKGLNAPFSKTFWCCWLLIWIFPFLFAGAIFAQTNSAATNQVTIANLSKRAERVYQAARTRLQSTPNDAEAAWQFGRAAFDWADYVTTDKERADIAQQGIAACRKVIEKDPESAVGHYYLGMNLGQLARTKDLGALKIVDQMEAEFKIALSLDPKLDHAGPDRNLGLLYRDAPGWPVSIGSKSKSKTHLQNALKLAPEYPENLLNVIEADLKWGDKNGAIRELKKLDELWPTARQEFAGDAWISSWADWEKRRGILQKHVSATSKALQPPHEKP
ncbi:MAG: hypothetical protein JWQ71_17 [Pedosphaera sp.]|nr:hypothetical protein [Pedosphaera sp.]